MYWRVVILISCVKLLLIPSYRSTDFEVHRNWLAITHSLPVSKWYYDSTSEWTLDYPPLFAWFEFCLSQVAKFFDPQMLVVENLQYASTATILFQRLSVIMTDFLLAYSTRECCLYLSSSGIRKSSKWNSCWRSPSTILQFILLGNAGLLMIDHIHFQYNGFLFGILILSIARMFQERYLSAAFWFAVLLNFKHIFIYIAPAYFIYLLRNYCFGSTKHGPATWKSLMPKRLIKLGLVVVAVFLVSFGPFLSPEQITQVFTRLFPFKRGLCHAYWAPNFWALYNTVDKAAVVVAKQLGISITNTTSSMTGGLVKEFSHVILPEVSPKVTFLCTLLSIVPAVTKLWKCPGNPFHFVRCIVLCACSAFMFGWHVHEKAVLMVIIPLSLLAVVWRKEAQIYLLFATIGHYSLFPLFFTAFELPIKVLLLLIHSTYAFNSLSHLFSLGDRLAFPLLSLLESGYLIGLIPLFIVHNLLYPLTDLSTRYPFLPLMATSVYCSIGISYAWLRYYWYFMTISDKNHKRKTH